MLQIQQYWVKIAEAATFLYSNSTDYGLNLIKIKLSRKKLSPLISDTVSLARQKSLKIEPRPGSQTTKYYRDNKRSG